MSIKITLANLAIAALSLTAMGSIGIVVTTAIARNTTAGATDTSNMTTFEENMTVQEIQHLEEIGPNSPNPQLIF